MLVFLFSTEGASSTVSVGEKVTHTHNIVLSFIYVSWAATSRSSWLQESQWVQQVCDEEVKQGLKSFMFSAWCWKV